MKPVIYVTRQWATENRAQVRFLHRQGIDVRHEQTPDLFDRVMRERALEVELGWAFERSAQNVDRTSRPAFGSETALMEMAR